MENDNKDENHVDDQENDMTNNSKEEEEKTVQNPPIENHDNSRNKCKMVALYFPITSERCRGVSMGLHIIIRSPV
jgi:hypothetical protein